MKRAAIFTIGAIVFLMATACKKQYAPQLVSVSTNFLAVDGPIISGDSTFIRLSRTTGLTDTTQNKAELKAIITVESDQNNLYPLSEKGKGVYYLGVTTFDKNRKYRLNIKTSNGKVYQSEFVPMKVTPAIDSIYIKQSSSDEITFYANAHDGTNSTRYYRWDYKDAWSYVPIYFTNYQYKNGVISTIVRNSIDDVSICYRTSYSSSIVIGSTTKLAQDVVSQQPIARVNNTSEKIAHPYTIQLRQYALTKEGYDYYENLKKNTEQLGSIFDSQPSAFVGNIHCVSNPTEVVLGFVSASTVANKQFDLLEKDNPLSAPEINLGITGINRYAYPKPYYESCATNINSVSGQGQLWSITSKPSLDLTKLEPQFYIRANIAWGKGDSSLVGVELKQSNNIYYYAPTNCVDCRLRGGTNIRPAYYPAR